MKKFASLFLALVMVCSLSVSVFAASNETVITYTGEGSEAYTITVPTTLQPGQSGEVKAEGTWATNRTLKVTTDSTVTVANSIDGGEKVLDVTFAGIEQAGDNENSITVSKTISVGDISDALFGTWTGVITYNVSMVDNGASSGGSASSDATTYTLTKTGYNDETVFDISDDGVVTVRFEGTLAAFWNLRMDDYTLAVSYNGNDTDITDTVASDGSFTFNYVGDGDYIINGHFSISFDGTTKSSDASIGGDGYYVTIAKN